MIEIVSSSSTYAEAPEEPESSDSVAYVGTEHNVCNNCSTFTIDPQAGIVAGDNLFLMLAATNKSNSNPLIFNTPTGWSVEQSLDGAAVFSRVADGSESTITISNTGSYAMRGGGTYIVTKNGAFGSYDYAKDILSDDSISETIVTPAQPNSILFGAFGGDNNNAAVTLNNSGGVRIAELQESDGHYSAWVLTDAPATPTEQGYDWGDSRVENAAILFSVETPVIGMVTRWLVEAGDTVTLPLASGYNYNFTVDWGDGSPIGTVTSDSDPDASHTFSTAGIYDVLIQGTLEAWDFENVAQTSAEHLIAVGGLSDLGWKSLSGAFVGAHNLRYFDAGHIGTSPLSNLDKAFYGLNLSEGEFNNLDTSNVTSMNQTFEKLSTLDLDVKDWNTSSVTSMNTVFKDVSVVQNELLNLSSWNVALVTDMTSMFENSEFLNLDLSNWDTSGSPSYTNWLDGMDAGLKVYCNDPDNGGTGADGTGTVNGRSCDVAPTPQVIASSSTYTIAGSTIDVPYPAAIASGNLLILQFGGIKDGGNITLTDPTGWTLVGGCSDYMDIAGWVYSKVADGTESGSLSIDIGGTNYARFGSMLVLNRGVVTATRDCQIVDEMNTGSSSINPTNTDSLIVGFLGGFDSSVGSITRSNTSVNVEETLSTPSDGGSVIGDTWTLPWTGSPSSITQTYTGSDMFAPTMMIEIAPGASDAGTAITPFWGE